jgi:hypothetical protein
MAKQSPEPSKSSGIPAMTWTQYPVSWLGLTKLCGSVPSDPELVKAWLLAREPRVRPPGGRSLDEINEEVLASLDEDRTIDASASAILTFQRQDGVCVMRAATVKAHLKDCARRLSARVGRVEGESAFSTKVINYVYPDPTLYWIPILRPEGTPVTKHDGEMDRPITTRFGTALKRFEWVEPWRLDFTLHVFTTSGKPAVGPADLDKLMLYGGVHGYAGERGNGEGRYLATTLTPEGDE